MTKKEALVDFQENILPGLIAVEQKGIGRKDKVMRAEGWNNYTDSLCKSGQISSKQYNNWSNPY